MLIFWSLVRNSVVLAVYLLFSVACFLTVHEHQNKASSKELTEIAEQKETASSMPVTAPVKAARRAGIAVIRHARAMSQDSGKQEDQEAIDNLEVSARNTAADTADALLDARDSLKSRIKKKRPDIKNTKDIKSGVRTINKADRSIKSATEATRIAAKSAQEAAKQAAITSQKVASAKKAEQLARKSAEWVKKIVKGIIEGLKRLGAALGAASVPLLLILVLASLIAGIVASAFGIFFAGDESGENTRTLQEVVLEINGEYNGQIEQIKTNTAHDELVMEGYQAPWPDVLSVYAVYVTTRTDGATDVVHLTDDNVNTLKTIFWQMNTITSYTETKTETIQVPDLDEDGNQKKDEDGNLLYKEETITTIILHITIAIDVCGSEKEVFLKDYICGVHGIRYINLSPKLSDAEITQAIRKAFSDTHIHFNTHIMDDLEIIRERYAQWKKKGSNP